MASLACVGIRLKSWYIRWYGVGTNKSDTNMALTDMEIRAAKPSARIVKLSDGGGLQLWLMPDGAKRWRLAYRLRRQPISFSPSAFIRR